MIRLHRPADAVQLDTTVLKDQQRHCHVRLVSIVGPQSMFCELTWNVNSFALFLSATSVYIFEWDILCIVVCSCIFQVIYCWILRFVGTTLRHQNEECSKNILPNADQRMGLQSAAFPRRILWNWRTGCWYEWAMCCWILLYRCEFQRHADWWCYGRRLPVSYQDLS